MADEQILIQMTVEDKQAIEEVKKLRGEINKIKEDASTLNKKVDDALTGTAKSAEKTIPTWKKLRHAIQVAFGLGLYSVVRQTINFFKELIKAGEETATTIFELSAAVRALQRVGTAVTMAETLRMVRELRQEYGVFTTREIMGGVANVMLLSRSFQFTTEQMKTMLRISADLAVVLGKDMNESAKQLALFISSGYGEALQRAGIAVNRLSVVQEAWRMGIKKSYMALTEAERAQAAYNLLAKHANDLHEDATNIQDELIGRIRAEKAEVENLKNAIGLGLLPVEEKTLKAKIALYNTGIWVFNRLIEIYGRATTMFAEFGAAVVIAGHNLKNAFTLNWREMIKPEDFIRIFTEIWNTMDKGIEEAKIEPLDIEKLIGLDVSGERALDVSSDQADRLEEIAKDLRDRILNLQEDYNDEMLDNEEDFADDMNAIDEKLLEANADAWEDYYEEIAQIQLDYEKSVAKAQEKYDKGLRDLAQDTQSDVADANRKYRENEEKAERDHQERLRKLREEFLFDLEDALRERDALQVLRLIRRYNLDVEQENRQNEERLDELKKQHQQELEEIRRNEAEKRQELWESLQEELADAQQAAEEKRAEAEAQRQKAIEEALADAEEARQERIDEYNKELEDAKIAFEAKKEELIREWAETNNITAEESKLIAQVLEQYFGKAGIADYVFEFFKMKMTDIVIQTQQNIGLLQSLLGQAMSYAQQISTYAASSTYGVTANPNPEQHASGGSLLLTRPHLFVAGEVPERIDITPLNQLNSNKQGAQMGGKGIVEIRLGEGLVGEIIDNTLGEVSIIMDKGIR